MAVAFAAGAAVAPPITSGVHGLLKSRYVTAASAAHPVPVVTGDRSPSRKLLDTHFYALSVRTIALPASTERGALAIYGDDVIISDRFGTLHQINPRDGAIAKLPFAVPVDLRHDALAKFDQKTLSVLDIEVRENGAGARLFASYLTFDPDRGCVAIALSTLDLAKAADRSISATGDWSLLYKTRPCVAIGPIDKAGLYGTGGRIAFRDDRILLSVGSLGLDGLNSAPMPSQQPDQDYGKILLIDPATGKSEMFSMGHRNPQGLAVLADGRILESEHGPRGGDEINFIVRGENYGWPLVTYGTRVYYRDWPLNASAGRHESYRKPEFAFIPSLGTSQLIEVRDSRHFPVWNGDILLSTLLARSLMRIHFEDQRVVYVEKIELGHRIRDLGALSDGLLVALTDDDRFLVIGSDPDATAAKIGSYLH